MQSRLKERFDDTERVELALIGGLWNMTNRLFNTLEVDLEPLVEESHKKLMYDAFGVQKR
ncbi:MAG: hypothetical protein ACRDSJ_12760 [Rubrobacteraceae bacterium]